MSNVNITVTPNPGVRAAQPAPPVRHAALNTRRSLLKYVLLGLVTFGIYDLWQMAEITNTVNLVCTRRDGKRTMNYLLMFLLVGWLTLGVGWLVWGHRLSARIGMEQAARRLPVTMTASTFWLWNILGALIVVGPFVYTYRLLHAMNDVCADYNQRG
ncbi:hypothetical protein BW14_08680 [Bifidobacterium sp. UTBIF-68]|uniref:DUF4234 domain-containing protein n=1 Tax=Bifidobacterium sp. UTBIF-68 TaxID=1465262 RepID=UPI00112C1E64|nr:DUF4234 domain-containing protein [Bifidobacterium sp. UTBIF-68]TPF92487.1 hypothetical protein BW14_08680 [Bifidobacterium sp. UTBIF-68]